MLGLPTDKVKQIPTGSLLLVERALTDTERRKMLDAADMLPKVGGLSRDRYRYKSPDARPMRKGFRPWRNRAIIYTLIETGMRRAAVCKINLANVDFETREIEVEEKGGATHTYKISRDGLAAISDYLEQERKTDKKHFSDAPALFLPADTVANSDGRLTPLVINNIWAEVCKAADVHNKTPHSARHAMGRYIIEKTGNVAAVQRQLGHKNAAYSLQYARITGEELGEVLDERE
jgi:integrase